MNMCKIHLILLVLLYSTPGYKCSKISGPSFIDCQHEEFKYSSAHCADDCNIPLITQSSKTYDVYSLDHPQDMLFGICRKVRRTTKLTEFWTFSTIDPVITRETAVVSKDECLSTWEKNCHFSQCLIGEPDIPSDYSYASTATFIDEYILIDVSRSTSTIRAGIHSMISTPIGLIDYDAGYALGSDGSAYIWEYNPGFASPCKLKSEGFVQCYEMNSPVQFTCPKLGITVDKTKTIPADLCGATLYQKGGILLKEGPVRTGHLDDIDMLAGESLTFMFSSIRDMLEEQGGMTCFQTCANLGNLPVGSVISLKTKLLKKRGESTYSECGILPHCSMVWPITLCAGTKKIQIQCGSVKFWWDGEKGVELVPTICDPTPSLSTELELDLGSEVLIANRSGYFWRESPITPGESLLPFDYKKVHDLSTQQSTKMGIVSSRLSAEMSSSLYQVDRAFDFDKIMGTLLNWFHSMKFIFIVVGVIALFSLYIYGVIKFLSLLKCPKSPTSIVEISREKEDGISEASASLIYQS